MARRRYLSTKISTDRQVGELIERAGEFAGLLYTWLIPHLDDWGRMGGEPDEVYFAVVPRVIHRTPDDVDKALQVMAELGLIARYTVDGRKYIAVERDKFNKYQTNIPKTRRAEPGPLPPPPGEVCQTSAKCGEHQQESANIAASPSPSPSHSLEEEEEEEESAREGDDVQSPTTDELPTDQTRTAYLECIKAIQESAPAAALTSMMHYEIEQALKDGLDPPLVILLGSDAHVNADTNEAGYFRSAVQRAKAKHIRTVPEYKASKTVKSGARRGRRSDATEDYDPPDLEKRYAHVLGGEPNSEGSARDSDAGRRDYRTGLGKLLFARSPDDPGPDTG